MIRIKGSQKDYCQIIICVITLCLLFTGCSHDKATYIDYIKVSDNTYLGVSEVATKLDVPWDIQFSPSTNSIFLTEIKGQISELDLETNTLQVIYQVPNVYQKRTLGLLGLAIHPQFHKQPYLYVCYTTKKDSVITSELAKLKYENGKIVDSKVLLTIDGGTGHNGSRLVFDNDGMLYWATGDAHSKTHAQDSTTLNGKVLRMTADGKIPSDNPIPNSYVYAWGFRNIQGMSFTPKGNLMTAEHGDAIEDEINWVRSLNNYGWIDIEGYHDTPKEIEIASNSPRTEPIKSWTPVIAPAGLKYYANTKIAEWNNSLLLTTLKSQSLRVLKLNIGQTKIIDEEVFLKDYYGRIRAVTTDNKGNVYLATSNKDWNPQQGFPKADDDRILKLSKVDFVPEKYLSGYKPNNAGAELTGKQLYESYCASCHKPDGMGIEGTFPPLSKTNTVKSEEKLIKTVLYGLNEEINVNGVVYNQAMPSFQFLSDVEVSKILNYVRTNFGNTERSIETKHVLGLRK